MRQADDGVHRRADFVAHVREEHGLHLRGFLGLLFGHENFLLLLFAQGDVGETDDRAHDGAVLQHRRGAIFDRQTGAVLAPEELIVNAAGLAVLVGGVHRTFFLGIIAAVGPVMVEGGVRWLPDQFLRRESQHPAGRRVHEGDAPFGVRAENALGARFKNEPGAFLGLPSFFAFQSEAERVGHRLGGLSPASGSAFPSAA